MRGVTVTLQLKKELSGAALWLVSALPTVTEWPAETDRDLSVSVLQVRVTHTDISVRVTHTDISVRVTQLRVTHTDISVRVTQVRVTHTDISVRVKQVTT